MDHWSFDTLLDEMKKSNHSDNKVAAIQTSLAQARCISAEQVAALIQCIPFDSVQLEVAKMAYPFAINKSVYGTIVGNFPHRRMI